MEGHKLQACSKGERSRKKEEARKRGRERKKGRKEEGKKEKGGREESKQNGRVARAFFYLLCFATRCRILSRSSALNPARR